MAYATFKENYMAAGGVISKPYEIFKKIHKKGKKYLPAAIVLLLVTELLNFLDGFSIETILKFVSGIITPFIYAALLIVIGKKLYNGKAEYWGLFSSLGFVRVALVFLPLALIGVFNPILLILLTFGLIVYLIILSISAVSICHKIKPIQAFLVMLISVVIIVAVELAFIFTFGLSSGNVVGQAIHLAI